MAVIGLAETLAAFLFIFFLTYLIWNKKSPVINWPMVGILPSLLFNIPRIHDYFTKILKQSHQTFEIKLPFFYGTSLLLTSDPRNIDYVLSANFASFPKGKAFKEIFDLLGDGLLAAETESESWKMERKLVHTLFRQSSFLKLVEETAEQKLEKGMFKVLDHVSDSGLEVDMQDLCQRLTLDLTCSLLVGCDPSSLCIDLPDAPLGKAVEDMDDVVVLRHFQPMYFWKLLRWLNIGSEKKTSEATKTFNNFICHHISLKREKMYSSSILKEEATGENYDLISRFMKEEEQHKLGESKLSDTFVRDAVMNLLVAGKSATGTALSWFLWIVATNPVVAKNIREELKANFYANEGDNRPRMFKFQELNNLVYLHAALCETLRLYPPASLNHKSAANPDVLPSGHRVGKHTKIIISMYAMGRTEEIWGKDCLEFKPERWISEKGSIIHVTSSKFNVFGAGPRTCVGKNLAMIQTKIVAAAIIWNYQLHAVEDHLVTPSSGVVLRMKHGFMVRVTKNIV